MLSGTVSARLMGADLPEPSVPVRDICNLIAKRTGVTVREIKSQFVDHRIIRARHVAMVLARHYPKSGAMSYPEIGRALNRDHSSVVSAVRDKLGDVSAAILARAGADDKLTNWVDIALEEYDRIIGPKIEATKAIWRRTLAERQAGRISNQLDKVG